MSSAKASPLKTAPVVAPASKSSSPATKNNNVAKPSITSERGRTFTTILLIILITIVVIYVFYNLYKRFYQQNNVEVSKERLENQIATSVDRDGFMYMPVNGNDLSAAILMPKVMSNKDSSSGQKYGDYGLSTVADFDGNFTWSKINNPKSLTKNAAEIVKTVSFETTRKTLPNTFLGNGVGDFLTSQKLFGRNNNASPIGSFFDTYNDPARSNMVTLEENDAKGYDFINNMERLSLPAPLVSSSFAAGEKQTSPPSSSNEWSLKEIQDFVKENAPTNENDLSLKYCDDPKNMVYRSGNPPSSNFNPGAEHAGKIFGYCLRKCEYARTLPPSSTGPKFNNAKDKDGNYLVQYELVEWMDPNSTSPNGLRSYCRALPNRKYDGPGWIASPSGYYSRRAISPLYLKSQLDVLRDDIGRASAANDISYDLSYKTAPKDALYKTMQARLCSQGTVPKDLYDANKGWRKNGYAPLKKPDGSVASVGRDNRNYSYADFQMIGEYCYWVGHDSYNNDVELDNTGHGDFRKTRLDQFPDDCGKYTFETPNIAAGESKGRVYKMQLTPGALRCYACPVIYDFDEHIGKSIEMATQLYGDENDGYRCAVKCPLEMYTTKSFVNQALCIPVGIPMEEILPKKV